MLRLFSIIVIITIGTDAGIVADASANIGFNASTTSSIVLLLQLLFPTFKAPNSEL